MFTMLTKVMKNTSCCNLNNWNMLREVIVKIRLKIINIQEEVTVEVLLNSSIMGLAISLEFTRKQRFNLKKIERPIYMRNVNSSFNKKGPIKHMVEVNIYYQEYRERTDINMIGGQKQSVILEILWISHHNLEIDWRTEEVKIIRCLEKYKKQQRPKQGKLEQQKQKKEEKKKKEQNK